MKAIKRWGLLTAVCVIGILGIVVLLGCSEIPTAPTNESGNYVGPTVASSRDKTVTKLPKTDSLKITKEVGPTGDTIKITIDRKGHTTGLFVPPGALHGRAQITMTVTRVRHVSGVDLEYEFTPEGLQFSFESTLFLDVSRPTGSTLTLSWYNPSSKQWEVQGVGVVVNGRASFPLINHFSKYGISCRGNGS